MAPILDVETLRRAVREGARPKYRLFWGHRPRKDGAISDACFSQWWPCRFVVDGESFTSAEQFMMAEKARLFGDEEARAKIMATADPGRVKAIGRQVRSFEEARWCAARFDLVTRGNVAKFGQDARIGRHLASTGEEILVEASPVDVVWGIGLPADREDAKDPLRWRGLNLLGFALMRARAVLRGELPPCS